MKTLTIRGIDPELYLAIKSCAKQNNLSMNQWVLQALKNVTEMSKRPAFKKYHDLDTLAGGWSKKETAAFRKNTKVFEKINLQL